ncbi:hypothetical protein GCM10018952_01260 [Streptosporangium vulgare]
MAKAVLLGAVPPLMLRTDPNPEGQPILRGLISGSTAGPRRDQKPLNSGSRADYEAWRDAAARLRTPGRELRRTHLTPCAGAGWRPETVGRARPPWEPGARSLHVNGEAESVLGCRPAVRRRTGRAVSVTE